MSTCYVKWQNICILLNRTITVFDLLRTGSSFLLIDSDHLWLKSPLDWIRQQSNQDILVENNGIPSKPNICAGMIFLNNTVATRKVWAEVTKHYEECRAMRECQQDTEQSILSKILKSRANQIISWNYFPLDHVFSGKWYRDETLRYNKTFHNPFTPLYLSLRKGKDTWSIHFNWMVGNKKKLRRMKLWNHSYYNESSDNCM